MRFRWPGLTMTPGVHDPFGRADVDEVDDELLAAVADHHLIRVHAAQHFLGDLDVNLTFVGHVASRPGLSYPDVEEADMAVVTCTRCKTASARDFDARAVSGRDRADDPRQRLRHCWREWLSTQVKYINEYRFSPLDPTHFEFLLEQAKSVPQAPGSRGEGMPEPGTKPS